MSQMLKTSAMRIPSKTDVGPFQPSEITDYVRCDLVMKQKVPIVLEQRGRYAVLAPPGKDLRIVCLGCFEPNMSLTNDRKCKKVSSYCQHWEAVKRGAVKCHLENPNNMLEECVARYENSEAVEILEKAWSPTKQQPSVIDVESLATKVLKEVDTAQLVAELKKREDDFKYILPLMDIETVVQFTKEMGVKPLYDSRFSDLEAEMRRITDPTRPGIDTFYAANQEDDKPHYTEKPMVTFDVMSDMHREKELKLQPKISDLTEASEGTTALVTNKRQLDDIEDGINSSKCVVEQSNKAKFVVKRYNTRTVKKRKVANALKHIS